MERIYLPIVLDSLLDPLLPELFESIQFHVSLYGFYFWHDVFCVFFSLTSISICCKLEISLFRQARIWNVRECFRKMTYFEQSNMDIVFFFVGPLLFFWRNPRTVRRACNPRYMTNTLRRTVEVDCGTLARQFCTKSNLESTSLHLCRHLDFESLMEIILFAIRLYFDWLTCAV